MITLCAIRNNPARDIVEGRTILPTVATVPVQEFCATPKAEPVEDNDLPTAEEIRRHSRLVEIPPTTPVGRPKKKTISPIREAMAAYRLTNPGEFTAADAAKFLAAQGLTNRSLEQNAFQLLGHLAYARQADCRRELKANGAAMHTIWWFLPA